MVAPVVGRLGWVHRFWQGQSPRGCPGCGSPGVGSPILVGAIPPWLPRLWVAKRVGTGARPLPEVEGSKVKCIPLIRL
ncbi:hypothetical protein [Prochlorothrix hollandica]|uniref:hypothetical protein n=1 Tax=Prochlorothrix hollandica TaxID=1223 RepID=UPI0012B57BDB